MGVRTKKCKGGDSKLSQLNAYTCKQFGDFRVYNSYISETIYLENYMGERNYMDIVIRHSETLEQLAYNTF